MDKADADLVQQLFAEANDLRAKNHALNRELVSKSLQIEALEEELQQARANQDAPSQNKNGNGKKGAAGGMPTGVGPTSKDLEEALYTIDRKNNEIRQLKDEIKQLQVDLEAQEQANDQLEKDFNDLQNDFDRYKASREAVRLAEKPDQTKAANPDATLAKQLGQLRDLLAEAEAVNDRQKRQIQDMTSEAARKYAEQQTQLQGLESLLDQVKHQYEEFIQVTKLENDSYRQLQTQEYERLKVAFETHKKEQYDEKRAMMMEHQAMLYTLQTLFEEYKKTSEFLVCVEISKLEDEIINQSIRYENEIMYIIQAKDKFYADMMVSKDAKIMNLIEGSDLTSLLQKHELDIENVRKEYTLELERIRTQQESEQKHVISLLQRQNSTLEAKADKLAAHIKMLETKIKDLIVALEAKNKTIAERDELIVTKDLQHTTQLEQERLRYAQVLQEKEFLRHKVIRLNMESKGTGENTIENMLKRISRETTEVAKHYGDLSTQYDALLDENGKLTRQIREREKWIEYLEREVKKRTEEFKFMVTTFESFLAQRSKQSRRERNKRLSRARSDLVSSTRSDGVGRAATGLEDLAAGIMPGSNGCGGMHAPLDLTVHPADFKTVRIRVPDVVNHVRVNELDALTSEKQEMDRAMTYLKRFKTMSRAFATGQVKLVGERAGADAVSGLESNRGADDDLSGNDGSGVLSDHPTPVIPMYGSHGSIVDASAHPTRRVYQVAERDHGQGGLVTAGSIKVYDYEAGSSAKTDPGSPPGAGNGAVGAMIGAFRGAKKSPLGHAKGVSKARGQGSMLSNLQLVAGSQTARGGGD
ncbi:hypothetical protein AMAG_17062 [Allomyces macrogynus ATCC 38327]|uniref:Uncharacterized protein n=2 Tax=Allomyces macrogynus (strain ATCC 38327) TaxID=578462 RepID=A0A0L0TDB7_ALLM3|nr:hypothetical protein AMAG_17062 [Allomyces macrogynus ATCC 38327]|eukprot:KNE72727.1 hypothetical protein AMAG_17062 [Allomyces macrogynus ATCC 38327]